MTTDPSDFSEHEQRLGEIVFACFQAVEKGQPLDRPGVLARHPEFASELRDFFAAQDKVNRLAAPLREVARAAQAEETMEQCPRPDVGLREGPPPQGTMVRYFGDYELLEEIGCGGNGVV